MSVEMNIQTREGGFTLIEIMVTIVIAMVVLGGLMLSFIQQNSEYKYQNKRIDAVQDLELGIKFIAEDLRSALIDKNGTNPVISISSGAGADPYTTTLTFTVWDASTAGVPANKRAIRKYTYDGNTLSYDRHDTGGSGQPMLSNVTFFKVFADNDTVTYPRGNFTGIPAKLPDALVNDPDGNPVAVAGYTILIEVAVDAGYKNGSFTDVKGNNVGITGKKRIWRYVQVHPKAVVN